MGHRNQNLNSSLKIVSKKLLSEFFEVSPNQIISLQTAWCSLPDKASSEEGFLATNLNTSELNALFNDGATFFLIQDKDELLGFAITTDIKCFTDQFSDPLTGQFDSQPEMKFENAKYLYQLVIKKGASRLGLGKELIAAVFAAHHGSILCDVLLEPIPNTPSIRFFENAGFKEIGKLRLKNYRNFGPLTSRVYLAHVRLR